MRICRAAFAALVAVALSACGAVVPIRGVDELAGEWRGRVSSPRGNAAAVLTVEGQGLYTGTVFLDDGPRTFHGSLIAVRPGQVRYQGTDGNGAVRQYDDGGRRVLKFLRDDGGVDAVFSR